MQIADSQTMSPELLLSAYSQGFFPMPDSSSSDILWYNPDPRTIIPLDKLHISKSQRKDMRNHDFDLTVNRCFRTIMHACSLRNDTWINLLMKRSYQKLHDIHFAHSIEIWHKDFLVGGVYGVAIGKAFFAESKFHWYTNASKIALTYLRYLLAKWNFEILEVQFQTPHLQRLGAIEISKLDYLNKLQSAVFHHGQIQKNRFQSAVEPTTSKQLLLNIKNQ